MQWGLIGSAIAAGAALIPLAPAIRRRAMNVTTILKKDHRVVRGLIMALEMTPRTNRNVRHKLFEQIRHRLTLHMHAEEEAVYPAMKMVSFGPEEGKIEELYREHQTLKDLMGQMHGMDPAGDEFEGKLKELKGNIQQHMTREENEMFKLLTDRISPEQLQNLGERVHQRKKDLKPQIAA